jgi:PAS domain-containing protein
MSIRDPWARAAEAIRLHEAHRALGAGAQAVRVDSAEALQLLEQKSERILAKLQEQWLAPFLQSNYGRTVIRLAKGDPEFAALPILDEDGGWAEMLSGAVAKVAHAVIVVDMMEPGTPMIGANEMFEKLSGYERDSVIGQNCRFLQVWSPACPAGARSSDSAAQLAAPRYAQCARSRCAASLGRAGSDYGTCKQQERTFGVAQTSNRSLTPRSLFAPLPRYRAS